MSKEKQTPVEESVEETVNKISPLHLAKLQESNQKLEQINQQAAELYQREFELKPYVKALKDIDIARQSLDHVNTNVLADRQKLIAELTDTYGRVNINPMTGEFQNMD